MVKFSSMTLKTAAGAAGLAAAGAVTAVPADASPSVAPMGTMEQISGANGAEVTDYTVNNLRPSGHHDGVWFADVTAKAAKGPVTPIIGDFNARAANGATYTAIEGANPGGLTNQPIPPGSARTGKVYFQVNNGTPPDSVVYNAGGNSNNALIWK